MITEHELRESLTEIADSAPPPRSLILDPPPRRLPGSDGAPTTAPEKRPDHPRGRRVARHQRAVAVAACVALMAGVAVVVGVLTAKHDDATRSAHDGHATQPTPTAVASTTAPTVRLAGGLGRFRPATPEQQAQLAASGGLTAHQAVETFKSHDRDWSPPADAIEQYGFFTLSKGGGQYTYDRKPAWAVTYNLCPGTTGRNTGHSTALNCKRWVLLDAYTGRLLVATFGPDPSAAADTTARIPYVVGRTPPTAVARLRQSGFTTITFLAAASALRVGTILAQTPAANALAATRSEITLTISAGQHPTRHLVPVPGIATCDLERDPAPNCLGGPVSAKLTSR